MFRNKSKQQIRKFSESGYTIMEGLVAMIVVAFLMSASAPVIILSVGNRVQARRYKLASFAGKSYIDAVRADVVPAPIADSPNKTLLFDQGVNLEVTANLTSCEVYDPDKDDSEPYCNNPTAEKGLFYCVDGDGDGECTPDSFADMMVHAGITDADGAELHNEKVEDDPTAGNLSRIGYRLYVKVYRANAFTDTNKISDKLPQSGPGSQAGLATRFTEGGNNIERPLFAIKTDIPPNDNSFSDWQNFTDRKKE